MKTKLCNQKGITTADIIVSVIFITVLISIIITASTAIESNNKKIERESEALYYAIQIIESAKGQDFSSFPTIGTNKIQGIEELADGYIIDQEGKETPYYRTVTVRDYKEVESDPNIKAEILKEVIVKVSYRENNEAKNVTLSTIISKEE